MKRSNVFFVLLLVCLTSNLFGMEPRGWADDMTQEERYHLALQDVKTVRPSEVYNRLLSVTPGNEFLAWGKGRNEGKVLVVSFMGAWPLQFYVKQSTVTKVSRRKFKSGDEVEGVRMYLEQAEIDKMKEFAFDAKGQPNPNELPSFEHAMLEDGRVSWVSVVPQAQYFLHKKSEKLSGDDLRNRFDERMGLPPSKEGEVKFFVEQWVDPEDLYRPTLDPQIFDTAVVSHRLHTDFLKKQRAAVSIDIFSPPFLKEENNQRKKYEYKEKKIPWGYGWLHEADKESKPRYASWVDLKWKEKHGGDNPMPWTALGYSYDYSAEAFNSDERDSHVGLGEFCIKPKSMVRLHAIYSVDKYARLWKERQKEMEERIVVRVKENIEVMKKGLKELTGLEKGIATFLSKDAGTFQKVQLQVAISRIEDVFERANKMLEEKINAYNDYVASWEVFSNVKGKRLSERGAVSKVFKKRTQLLDATRKTIIHLVTKGMEFKKALKNLKAKLFLLE